MIDLSDYLQPLNQFLTDGIRDFSVEHPEVEVSSVGLAADLFHRTIILCFDTAEHSDCQVQHCKQVGWLSYGTDDLGEFDISPMDFAYPEYRVFSFEGFPDFYESEPVQYFRDPSGGVHCWNIDEQGDEGLNELMWNFFLRDWMLSYDGFGGLRRAISSRFGLCMHNSDIVEFFQITEL